jgi:hypothetical protein
MNVNLMVFGVYRFFQEGLFEFVTFNDDILVVFCDFFILVNNVIVVLIIFKFLRGHL